MIFVRYEDMVRNNPGELRRLSDFLGFELDAADTSLDASARFAAHATSQSPLSSIGRWREQLVADEIETIDRDCQEFLELFGYDRESGELAPAASVGPLQPRPDGRPAAIGPADTATGMPPASPDTAGAVTAPLREMGSGKAAPRVKGTPLMVVPRQPERSHGEFRFIRRISA